MTDLTDTLVRSASVTVVAAERRVGDTDRRIVWRFASRVIHLIDTPVTLAVHQAIVDASRQEPT